MAKKILKRLGVALFVILIIFSAVYTVIYSRFNVISTEKVYTSRAADSIITDCMIIREEEVITADSRGFVSYTVDDAQKVALSDTVARIFLTQEETTSHLTKIRLTNELDMMKKLNANIEKLSTGINVVENQISSEIIEYNKSVKKGEYSQLDLIRNELMYYVSERKFLTGESENFDKRVEALSDKLSKLPQDLREASNVVSAQAAGVFSSSFDGYEDCFDYSDIENITLDDYQALTKKYIDENVVGKLVTKFDWYIVCPITAQQALQLTTEESDMHITFISASSQPVPVRLVKINQINKKSNGVAVFKCDVMNSELINLRSEEVQIDLKYYEGLRIPKKAVHSIEQDITVTDEYGNEALERRTVTGVYIKRVNELEFREISILYSASNYVICDASPSELLTDYGTVELYDDIVTQGADLYDGKVVK